MPDPLDLSAVAREAVSLAAQATPGPWESDATGVWTMHPEGLCGPVLDPCRPSDPGDGIGVVADPYPRGINHPDANMALIAHAGTHYAALATGYLALEAELQRLRAPATNDHQDRA